jgi:hypothetical protein
LIGWKLIESISNQHHTFQFSFNAASGFRVAARLAGNVPLVNGFQMHARPIERK